MDELKAAKYIISESESNRPELADMRTRILHLGADAIKDSFSVECVWYYKIYAKALAEAHTHTFDEVIAFIGSDPQNPRDLGGEVELWIDGEKHLITRSSVVFLPKGIVHCPLFIRKVHRPIFHFATVPVGEYKLSVNK